MLNAGTQRGILLGRVRDPLGNANSADLIWDLFTRLQWMVNAQIEDYVLSFILPLKRRQCVYQISTDLPINPTAPGVIKVLGVRDADRDLYPMEFDQLRGWDRNWFRLYADRPRWFSLCGYDVLVVGPAQDTLMETTAVNVLGKAMTQAIISDASNFQLQDENVQGVMELAEGILLAKARDWQAAQDAIKRALKTLDMEEIALRDVQPIVEPTTMGDKE